MHPLGCGARLLLAVVCATSASCFTASTHEPNFSGSWAFLKKCDSGHSVNLTIQQVGKQVTGDWSEGTNIRGGDGELKGDVRGAKLFVRYCATDGEGAMAACPSYEANEDYFVFRGEAIVRYQKYGSTYKEDVVLHRDDAGKSVPVDTSKCFDKEDQ
jgi:hypothetical protein